MKIQITNYCYCEHYLHEVLKYYREGLVKKTFEVGEIYEVEKKWNNFYGTYYRIRIDENYHDISIANCKIIERD